MDYPGIEFINGPEPDGGIQCVIHKGECVPIFEGIEDCSFEPGSCFRLGYPDTDIKQPLKGKPKMQLLPPMPGVSPSPPLPPSSPLIPAQTIPTPLSSPMPNPTGFPAQGNQALVGVQDTAGSDLSKLMPTGGQANGFTVLLALLAVVGGGAAWKFYSQRSKEQHELKLKEAELKATSNSDQNKKCDAAAVACSSASKELSLRCDELTRKINEQNMNIDALSKKINNSEESSIKSLKLVSRMDELEDKQDELERKVKRLSKQENS